MRFGTGTLYASERRDNLCRAAWETVRDVYAKDVDGDVGVPAMVGAVQTFGDLIHWHSHVHTIVSEGVFTESGHFVHIPDIRKHRAVEIWQEKVFSLLLDANKISDEIAGSMRSWRHSLQPSRLQPFGRRYAPCSPLFHELRVLAEVTQHIPNKGEHQIRYYGFYSNKSRGLVVKAQTPKGEGLPGKIEPDSTFRQKCRMTWAALTCLREAATAKAGQGGL